MTFADVAQRRLHLPCKQGYHTPGSSPGVRANSTTLSSKGLGFGPFQPENEGSTPSSVAIHAQVLKRLRDLTVDQASLADFGGHRESYPEEIRDVCGVGLLCLRHEEPRRGCRCIGA